MGDDDDDGQIKDGNKLLPLLNIMGGRDDNIDDDDDDDSLGGHSEVMMKRGGFADDINHDYHEDKGDDIDQNESENMTIVTTLFLGETER